MLFRCQFCKLNFDGGWFVGFCRGSETWKVSRFFSAISFLFSSDNSIRYRTVAFLPCPVSEYRFWIIRLCNRIWLFGSLWKTFFVPNILIVYVYILKKLLKELSGFLYNRFYGLIFVRKIQNRIYLHSNVYLNLYLYNIYFDIKNKNTKIENLLLLFNCPRRSSLTIRMDKLSTLLGHNDSILKKNYTEAR